MQPAIWSLAGHAPWFLICSKCCGIERTVWNGMVLTIDTFVYTFAIRKNCIALWVLRILRLSVCKIKIKAARINTITFYLRVFRRR